MTHAIQYQKYYNKYIIKLILYRATHLHLYKICIVICPYVLYDLYRDAVIGMRLVSCLSVS